MKNRFKIARRFGWVAVLSILAVTAVALAVAKITGRDVTAQSVVVATPGTSSAGPGQAQEARDLAATYVRQLGSDQALLRTLGLKTGLTGAQVRAGLSVTQVPNTAVVRVTFRGPSAGTVLNGVRALSDFATSPPATSSLSVVSPRLISISKRAAQAGRRAFRAQTSLVIPSASASPGPGNADQANKLAAILGGLIPQDQPTLDAVARRLRLPEAVVKSSVSVASQQNTSLITLSFKNRSASVAQRGADALARAVSGAHPVSPNIPNASLSIVALADRPGPTHFLMPALPAGIILGGLLGFVLMLAFDRAFPQVGDADALSVLAGCPAVPIDITQRGPIDALRRRWAAILGEPAGHVAVVAVQSGQHGLAKRVADAINEIAEADFARMQSSESVDGEVEDEFERELGTGDSRTQLALRAAASSEVQVRAREESVQSHHAWLRSRAPYITARAAGCPDGSGAAEDIVLDSDLVVLAVKQNTSDRDVERVVRLLADFDRAPLWALLLP